MEIHVDFQPAWQRNYGQKGGSMEVTGLVPVKHPIVEHFVAEVSLEMAMCPCDDCDPCDYEAS